MKDNRSSERTWGVLCIILGGLISYPIWQKVEGYISTGNIVFYSNRGPDLYGAHAAVAYAAYLLIGISFIAYGLSLLSRR